MEKPRETRLRARGPLRSWPAVAQLAIIILGVAACGGEEPDSPAGAKAADAPTFVDVAPIVYGRCAVCHRPGDAAPFSLLSYADVKKRGRQIAEVTETRYMPPWLPAPNQSDPGPFDDDRSLTEDELELLQAWIADGMLEGPPEDAPAPPNFVDAWHLGEPDLVLEMPESFTLPSEGRDVYRNFVIPAVPGAPRHVRAVEWRPDNRRIVHHAALFIDRTGTSRGREAADPAPGFSGMNIAPAQMPDGQFYGWTPGNEPRAGSDELSWRLDGRTDIVLQLHLRPTGKSEDVRIRIGLHFASGPPARLPMSIILRSSHIDIPPGESAFVVEDDYTLPAPVSVVSIYPHAHYLGKDLRAWFKRPGEERRQLFHIPSWDFNWQDDYFYERRVELPRGTEVSMRYVYDNSAENPLNPNHPPVRVRYGEQSTDEMAELLLLVVPDDPIDLPILLRDYARKELLDERVHYGLLARDQPDFAGWQRRLAEATLALGYPEASIGFHARWSELRPHATAAQIGLARSRLESGDATAAADAARAVLARSRSNQVARTWLGRALLAEGNVEAARSTLKRVLSRVPRDAEALLALGDVEVRAGDLALAEEHYRASIAASADGLRGYVRLARILDGDAALVAQRAAVEIYRTRFVGADAERLRNELEALRGLIESMRARGDADATRDLARWARGLEATLAQ